MAPSCRRACPQLQFGSFRCRSSSISFLLCDLGEVSSVSVTWFLLLKQGSRSNVLMFSLVESLFIQWIVPVLSLCAVPAPGVSWHERWKMESCVGPLTRSGSLLFFSDLVYLYCNWNIVDLQYCVSFWCTAKWFNFVYIYISFPLWFVMWYCLQFLCYTVRPCCLFILYIFWKSQPPTPCLPHSPSPWQLTTGMFSMYKWQFCEESWVQMGQAWLLPWADPAHHVPC